MNAEHNLCIYALSEQWRLNIELSSFWPTQYIRRQENLAPAKLFCICITGIFNYRLSVDLLHPGRRLRLLLRSHISHHQTSQQGGGQWSNRSESRRSHGNHVTWSERWAGSAAGDWSYNWQQIVSHGDECSQDNDYRCRRLYNMLECGYYSHRSQNTPGEYVFITNTS